MPLDYMAILATVAICLFARPLGEWLRVIDHPDNDRKMHPEPTPMVGGIAVMAPLALWACATLAWGQGADVGFYLSIMLCGGGVALVGFLDDQHTVSAAGRLLLLAIFATVALRLDPLLAGQRVHFATWGWLSTPPLLLPALTVLALAGFSSAVNLTDGLNGLVLALICIWSMCLAYLGTPELSEAACLVGAACAVTLLYNMRGRLFLGDCGAFAIAFVIGLMAVRCHNSGRLSLETALVWFYLPVMDCLRLIPMRLWRGRSPFRPDREHFHYRLSARLGERRAILAYAGVVGFTSVLATLAPTLWMLSLTIASVFIWGFLLADALAPKNEEMIVAGVGPNVVSLEKKLVR